MNQAAAEEALENLLNAVDERRQMDLKFAFEKLFWVEIGFFENF